MAKLAWNNRVSGFSSKREGAYHSAGIAELLGLQRNLSQLNFGEEFSRTAMKAVNASGSWKDSAEGTADSLCFSSILAYFQPCASCVPKY